MALVFLSIIFLCLICFLRFIFRLRYCGTIRNSGISYPNQHIDSDCFFADLPPFRALLHTPGYPAHYSSNSRRARFIEGRGTPAIFQEGNALRTSYAFVLPDDHAAWGAIDLVFRVFEGDDLFPFSLRLSKSDSFSLVIPLGEHSLFSSSSRRRESQCGSLFGRRKSFAGLWHIEGVYEGYPFLEDPLPGGFGEGNTHISVAVMGCSSQHAVEKGSGFASSGTRRFYVSSHD